MLNALTDEEDMKPVCSLLAVVMVMTLLLLTATPGDSDAVKNITAVLGHSVTFRCSSNYSSSVESLYVQKVISDKVEDFVNGFYKHKVVPVPPQYRDRTTVNKMDLSMEMRNISISDEGLYKCYVFIGNNPEISDILLKVTAEYSVPTIMKDCRKHSDGGTENICQLSCWAVDGYPQSTVRWAGINQSMINIIYNRSSADNESKTWTVNQTIVYNCNQPTNVSCAVGGAVSHTITICETESFPFVVIIVIVLVCVLLFLFAVVIKCCCGRQKTKVLPLSGWTIRQDRCGWDSQSRLMVQHLKHSCSSFRREEEV